MDAILLPSFLVIHWMLLLLVLRSWHCVFQQWVSLVLLKIHPIPQYNNLYLDEDDRLVDHKKLDDVAHKKLDDVVAHKNLDDKMDKVQVVAESNLVQLHAVGYNRWRMGDNSLKKMQVV